MTNPWIALSHGELTHAIYQLTVVLTTLRWSDPFCVQLFDVRSDMQRAKEFHITALILRWEAIANARLDREYDHEHTL